MSERSDKVRELFRTPKSQEPEETSKNESTQEIENIEQPEQAQTEEPNEADFDLSGFNALNNKISAKPGTQQGGGVSIVNSKAKGKCKRVELSTAVMDYLGLKDSTNTDDTVQFLIDGNKIAIGRNLKDTATNYYIRRGQKGEKRGIVYHSALVSDITEKFGLDFSDGRSCRSFANVDFKTSKGKKIVVVTVE